MNNRLTVLILTSMAGPLFAQGQEPAGASLKTLQAVRTDNPITLNGRLDEPAWATAAVAEDLHQMLPVEYSEPSQRTQFLVLYVKQVMA